jgi:hypothetical protein
MRSGCVPAWGSRAAEIDRLEGAKTQRPFVVFKVDPNRRAPDTTDQLF